MPLFSAVPFLLTVNFVNAYALCLFFPELYNFQESLFIAIVCTHNTLIVISIAIAWQFKAQIKNIDKFCRGCETSLVRWRLLVSYP